MLMDVTAPSRSLSPRSGEVEAGQTAQSAGFSGASVTPRCGQRRGAAGEAGDTSPCVPGPALPSRCVFHRIT